MGVDNIILVERKGKERGKDYDLHVQALMGVELVAVLNL